MRTNSARCSQSVEALPGKLKTLRDQRTAGWSHRASTLVDCIPRTCAVRIILSEICNTYSS